MKPEQLTKLSELGVATVYEASGRQGLIDIPLIQMVPGSRVAGPARTVRCGQDDNLMVHAVIEQILPGEVLVLTMPESRPIALIGDLLVIQMKVHQAAGVLIDAAVRDVSELVELGLPIWTHFVRVHGATKSSVGEINGTVVVGGTAIASGDIMILDADGAVCVRQDRAEAVLDASEKRQAHEAHVREQYRTGAISYDLNGLRELVERSK